MVNRLGKIIISADTNVWPHELDSAKALAAAGFTVEFIVKSEIDSATTPDLLLNGEAWEMKSPKSNKPKMIEQNIRRALHQCKNVILDSRRMRALPDYVIEREASKWANKLPACRKLLYISKSGSVKRLK